MPHTVLELFEAWQGKFAWHRHIDVWKLAPHCLIWCIGRERNARIFEGCERSLLEIKDVFVLGENHFHKCFSGNVSVWLVRKIEFFGIWFPLTEKKRLWLRKWISVPIFTSNEFQRERERERKRKASSNPVRRSPANPKLQSALIARTSRSPVRTVDRDLAFAPIAI